MIEGMGLGRRPPTDNQHQTRYPLRAMLPDTVATAERTLALSTRWRGIYDQGAFPHCVGYSLSQMMSILNRRTFDAAWLYHQAQAVDDWPGTDYAGTSVRAGCDILREVGHVQVRNHKPMAPDFGHGISANRWARTVGELRTCIASGVPVVVGTNWHRMMSMPNVRSPSGVPEYWMDPDNLGPLIGGHAYLLNRVSDRRQAFKTPNSWGIDWPERGAGGAWIPYRLMERLLNEDGEAVAITDR